MGANRAAGDGGERFVYVLLQAIAATVLSEPKNGS
jgi:hypothetical protein